MLTCFAVQRDQPHIRAPFTVPWRMSVHSLEREQNSLTSSRELKFGRFSPHAFHLDKKVEVFAAEGSPDHRQIHLSPVFSWSSSVFILHVVQQVV